MTQFHSICRLQSYCLGEKSHVKWILLYPSFPIQVHKNNEREVEPWINKQHRKKNATKIEMFCSVLIRARALMPAIWMPRQRMKGKISPKLQLSHLAKIKETPGGEKKNF